LSLLLKKAITKFYQNFLKFLMKKRGIFVVQLYLVKTFCMSLTFMTDGKILTPFKKSFKISKDNKMRFIGDVHGKIDQYLKIIADCDESIQVGDMGVGFVPLPETPFNDYNVEHYFIRGNHDNLSEALYFGNYLVDSQYWNEFGNIYMFVGGAESIDKHYRTEGVDWWRDEELSYAEFQEVINRYEQLKPNVMVTHDCPQSIVGYLKLSAINDVSATRQALQTMLDIHRPQLWVFGHWHKSLDITIDGTRFVCLNELEYKDIEL